MTSQNLLVRVLSSCEIMAKASVIFTDKTGTLTQNLMTVVAGSVCIHAKFVRHLEDNKARTNAGDERSKQDHDADVEKGTLTESGRSITVIQHTRMTSRWIKASSIQFLVPPCAPF